MTVMVCRSLPPPMFIWMAPEANDNALFGASLSGSYVEVSNSSFNSNGSGSDKDPIGRGLEVKVLAMHCSYMLKQLTISYLEPMFKLMVKSMFSPASFAGNQYYTYSPCKGSKGAGYGLKVVAAGDIFVGATPDDPGYGVEAYDNGAEGVIIEWSVQCGSCRRFFL